MFNFTIFVQKSVRINELLEISAFFQKQEIVQTERGTINVRKLGCARKERTTFNLPILVCVVNNIQGTSIDGFW